MFRIKTKVAGRVVVATLLSVGLAASTAGIASASQRGHHSSRYQHDSTTQSQGSWAFGVVSTYVAGTSISILAKGSTTPTTYALTAATTITGLDAGATLASPDRVVLVLSATTPVTVTSIKVLPAQSGSNGRDCGHHSGGANHSFGGRGSFGRGNHSGGGSSWNGNFRR